MTAHLQPETGHPQNGHPEDWHRWVVYQVYPRSFADGNGDGIGDLAGVLQHVDHLERLGVDVVWFSPLYRSPMDDNGYDISDYQDVDPVFGTLEELDAVIAALHERGIRVVMDLVVNHTSDEHPWFVESRSSRDNPKRDWYWWRDGRDGEVPEPTNWESAFSGPAWHLDEATGQYYLHLFSRKQPDLDWEQPEVRQAVYAMMRWWLDRGVDGFRMDVINLISKRLPLEDTQPRRGSAYGPALPAVAGGPRLHELLQEMHREVFAGRDRHVLTVGEMPGVTLEEAVLHTDPARGELDMVFQFEHVSLDFREHRYDPTPLSLPVLKASLARWQTALAPAGWNSLYFGNHDQPRALSRFGDDSDEHRVASAKALATVLHLHRGTPYVYQGDELGMRNAPLAAIEDYRDIEALNAYAEALAQGPEQAAALLAALGARSRDQARTPVPWDGTGGAGFSTGRPWIGLTPDAGTVNAAAQVGVPGSVFEHHRALIALRHDDAVVTDGDFTLLEPDSEVLWVFTRRTPEAGLLVAANFSRDVVPLSVPGWDDAEVVLDNLGQLEGPGLPRSLRPWQAVVWRR